MNKPSRAALASGVMLVTLFAGSSRYIRSIQPGFDKETSFDTRWPQDKAFQAKCPFASCSTVKAPPPKRVYASPLPMVWIAEKIETRLIIPSSTCPPRKGETGSCVLDGAIKPY